MHLLKHVRDTAMYNAGPSCRLRAPGSVFGMTGYTSRFLQRALKAPASQTETFALPFWSPFPFSASVVRGSPFASLHTPVNSLPVVNRDGNTQPFCPQSFSEVVQPNYIIRACCSLCSRLLFLVIISQCGRPPHTAVHRGQGPVMSKDSALYLLMSDELLKYPSTSAATCLFTPWNLNKAYQAGRINTALRNDSAFLALELDFDSAITLLRGPPPLRFFSQLRCLTMKTSPRRWVSQRAPSPCCCALHWGEELLSGTTNTRLTPTPAFIQGSSVLGYL